MVLKQLEYLYDNPLYLNYLRYNPKWYKILYYEPSMFVDFINEANEKMHLTRKDTLKDFNKKLSFVSSLMQYLAKK
jgi:hypothetical protein